MNDKVVIKWNFMFLLQVEVSVSNFVVDYELHLVHCPQLIVDLDEYCAHLSYVCI